MDLGHSFQVPLRASGNGSAPSRPVDLFFPEARKRTPAADVAAMDENTPFLRRKKLQHRSRLPPRRLRLARPTRRTQRPLPGPRRHRSGRAPAAKGETQAAAAEASRPKPALDEPAPSAEDEGVELVEVPGVRFAEILVTDIHPNRKQPRSVFDEDDMAELVHSVREIGVLQPIVVRTSTEEGGEPYELVMGERRWRAVQAAGLQTIPAIVRDTTDDDLLRDALLENLHRSQLNPLEEAAAYQQLLEDFGTTHEQLADRIGRSRPQVSNTLRLLKLPPLVQRRVAASVISAGHARALLALPDAAAMERLAQKIVAEGMSVRATEEAVTLYQNPSAAPRTTFRAPVRGTSASITWPHPSLTGWIPTSRSLWVHARDASASSSRALRTSIGSWMC